MQWLGIAVAALIAGCGGGYRSVHEIDELPAGTCPPAKLMPGESCSKGARDFSAGATVSVPHGHTDEVGGALWFRMPMVDFALDERTMRKGDRGYRSLAGGVGTHLRPMIGVPRVQRYLDVLVNLGFDLGVIDEDGSVQGRGDGYVGAAIDVFAPDLGPIRYLVTGVPGLRIGVRYTAFVEGWDGDTTFEIGLIWRWGVPIDLYRHWTTLRTGD